MAIFNRAYCPQCRTAHDIHKKADKAKQIICRRCSFAIEIKADHKNYYIEYYLPNGKRKREQVGYSRALAEDAYRKRRTEIKEGKFFDTKHELKVKFEDFADEYLELHCKPNHRGVRKAAEANLKVLKRFLSGKYLSEIDVITVERFKRERMQENVSPATVNRALACLKSMFNRAIDWGRYEGENPVRKVKLLKESNGRLRYLEKEEIALLIKACSGNLKAIVIVAINTGMRRGEIFGLKWKDIDYNRRLIYLYNTKNGEKREVPMNEDVINTLISVRKHPESPFVFCYDDGSPVRDIRKGWFKVLAKTGIKDFVFHNLRHTFCSQLVMAGVDINTVKELAGHKSIQMTLRYSHLSQSHKQHAVEILSQRLTSTLPKQETTILLPELTTQNN